MAGQGKYTTYISTDNDKMTFFKKLYGNSPFSDPDVYAKGDNGQVAAAVAAAGNIYLLAVGTAGRKQDGDIGHFPNGVSMDYSFTVEDPSAAPDLTTIKWTNPGDPSNAYFPDLISAENAVPRDADPAIKPEDIKPNYVPGAEGTVNPTDTNDLIDAAAQLLAPMLKGHSHV